MPMQSPSMFLFSREHKETQVKAEDSGLETNTSTSISKYSMGFFSLSALASREYKEAQDEVQEKDSRPA